MTTDDLEYLLAVAQHRNIGRAAEALGLTQPALTRAVARIEALAGQQLFSRHPRGMEPTPAGEIFLQRARQMLSAFDDAMRELQQLKAGRVGLLRVGYSPSVDEDVMVRASRALLLERPAAQLRLVERLTVALMTELAGAQLDLLVGPVLQPLPDDCEATLLYDSRMHVIADLEHPLCRAGSATLEQLSEQQWLLSDAGNPLRREMDALMGASGLPPIAVRVESDALTQTQFRMLRGTQMLGLCSDWWLKTLGPLGLARVDAPEVRIQRQIAVIRRRGAYVSPLSQRFTELLLAEIGRRAPRRAGTVISGSAAAARPGAPASA